MNCNSNNNFYYNKHDNCHNDNKCGCGCSNKNICYTKNKCNKKNGCHCNNGCCCNHGKNICYKKKDDNDISCNKDYKCKNKLSKQKNECKCKYCK